MIYVSVTLLEAFQSVDNSFPIESFALHNCLQTCSVVHSSGLLSLKYSFAFWWRWMKAKRRKSRQTTKRESQNWCKWLLNFFMANYKTFYHPLKSSSVKKAKGKERSNDFQFLVSLVQWGEKRGKKPAMQSATTAETRAAADKSL